MSTYRTSARKRFGCKAFGNRHGLGAVRARSFWLYSSYLRASTAALLTLSLIASQVVGASALGTVTSALDATIGDAPLSPGSTIFSGDQLRTERTGSIQIRLRAARFVLTAASFASFGEKDGTPTATLTQGMAVFSTANAKAFVLKSAKAEIRAKTDAPTVGQVTYVSEKELRVRCDRGSLAITVDDETQYVEEGRSYRVMLDPDAYYAEHPEAAPPARGPSGDKRALPHPSGRSRFVLVAIAAVAWLTIWLVHEAWESNDSP